MKTTIEMAREAAGDDWGLFWEYMPEIHRLVELVRADERARMAEQPAPAPLTNEKGQPLKFWGGKAEQPAQQEPVAWMQNTTAGLYVIDHYDKWHCIPLYTNPQAQRTWVGLTDEEIQTTWNSVMRGDVFTRRDVYKAIEAKLREKST